MPEPSYTRLTDVYIPVIYLDNYVIFPGEEISVPFSDTGSLGNAEPMSEIETLIFSTGKNVVICALDNPSSGVFCEIVACNTREGILADVLVRVVKKAKIFAFAEETVLDYFRLRVATRVGVFDTKISDERKYGESLGGFLAQLTKCLHAGLTRYMKREDVDRMIMLKKRISVTDAPTPEQLGNVRAFMYFLCEKVIKTKIKPEVLQFIIAKIFIEEELEFITGLLASITKTLVLKNALSSDSKKAKTGTAEDSQPLGNSENDDEVSLHKKRFEEIKERMSVSARKEIEAKIGMLARYKGSGGAEMINIGEWVPWALSLPFGILTGAVTDLAEVQNQLDKSHFGLEGVKKEIMRILSVRAENPNAKGRIICFVGPAGVGKTSIAKAIAQALGLKFVHRALGGVRDEADIRGHRRTYIAAMPGEILKGLTEAGCDDPLFLLDEIDKLKSDARGDPTAALMEVLDPEQNHSFRDHYANFTYDVSKVFFICTANTTSTIPPPLLDRMKIIKIPGYFEHEKLAIAKDYLIGRQLRESGLSGKVSICLSEETLKKMIAEYTFEAGVRRLEQHLGTIMGEIARLRQVENKFQEVVDIAPNQLVKYLGEPGSEKRDKYRTGIGEVIGLSVSESNGARIGDILPVICALVPGRHKREILLTGNPRKVMRQCARTAVSCAQIIIDKYRTKLPIDFRKNLIHIEYADASVPKDGPSAGITTLIAILSAVFKKKIRPDIAMTGEIGLNFRISAVGGIKEKVLAAERAHIKEVMLPAKNRRDFNKLPVIVRKKIKPHFVSTVQEALAVAFGEDIVGEDIPTVIPVPVEIAEEL